jgi:hemoglobin/transferrin/lactoferrin receptor protein
MKFILSLCLLFGFVCAARTQTINITDIETGEPIATAELSSISPKITAITNELGQADISAFSTSDKILIKHTFYKSVQLSYAQLRMLKFKVELFRNIHTMSEVSVSTQRRKQKTIDTPNRVASIDMKEAAFQNPQTAADLLGTSGYAFIQKSQMGGGSPMLRGMATNRVLLVVDGVRMNNAIFRSGNLQNVISLDANAMESTDILFGPGSVMFGSDAIGGVMSFGTLTPKFSTSENKKPTIDGSALARYSTANNEKTGHLDLSIGFKKIAFTTSFTSANYGDLRSGSVKGVPYFYRNAYVVSSENEDFMVTNNDSTLQLGSKYSQINFMQKVRYKPNQYLDIDYAFHYSETSRFNRYDRLYIMRTSGQYKDKLRWAEWYYGPQKWQMHRLGVQFSKKNKAFDTLRMIAAYQLFEESRYDREFMKRELNMQKENVNAYSINLDADKTVTEKLTLYYGAEFVHNTIYSIASVTNIDTDSLSLAVTRYPDGSTWQSKGVYLTGNYRLNKKWLITAGIRYNHFEIKADFDTTFFPFPFTKTKMSSGSAIGSSGLVFTPYQNWQIYLNAANGFRAPNVDDMGKVFESVPGYLVVPNPALKPEKAYNLELGTVKSFGSFLTVDATVYRTWLTDAMVRKESTLNGDTTILFMGDTSRIQSLQNVTKINVIGVQAGIELYYKGFGLRSNISFQDGKEQTPDSLVFYPLRHAAPTFGSTHLTYEYRNKLKADFYVIYNAKMDFDDLALTERVNASYARDEANRAYVSGWYTLNFKLAYTPSPFITLSAGVENIADIMYRPYSSGINAPGRNFITSIRVKF